jgi:hypothetical protein
MEQCAFSWTAFPPLPLRGLGTEMVEQLDYYALRLSWTTGWSVRQLSSLMEREGAERLVPLHPSCYLFGNRREAQVAALERFTGNPDLRYGTLWVLKEVVNARGLCHHGGAMRRWCPVCYKHWDPDTSWEPLVWFIPYVSRCPDHGCDLVDKCLSCGATQRRHTPIDRRLYCRDCGEGLGGEGTTTDHPKFYDWVDKEVCKLVAFCSMPGREPISRTTLSQFMERFEAYTQGQDVMPKVRRCLALQRSAPLRRPISLSRLLNFSAFLGTSVVDLLARPQEAMSAPLLDLWSGFHWLYEPFAKKDDEVRAARWLVRKVLANCGKWYLPSMRILSKDIGVSPSRLKAFDPEAYQAYIDAYLRQCGPSARYSRGVAFAAARLCIGGMGQRMLTNQRMWWVPQRIANQAPVDLEDATHASYGAIVYSQLLAKASRYAKSATMVKEDVRWIESAPVDEPA